MPVRYRASSLPFGPTRRLRDRFVRLVWVPTLSLTVTFGGGIGLATGAGAQSTAPATVTVDGTPIQPDAPTATRAELTQLLESTLRTLAAASTSGAERTRAEQTVATVRRRREAGDFRPGDRFVVTLVADTVQRTEMVVRDGPSVEFGAIPALSLAGVLRAELDSVVTTHLSRYYRNPQVRVQQLTRITVAGPVARPGPVSVPPDVIFADIFSAAGGLTAAANTENVVVRRGTRQLLDQKAVQRAIRDGVTLSTLGIQSGDEIVVAQRNQNNWWQTARAVGIAVTVVVSVLALIRATYAN